MTRYISVILMIVMVTIIGCTATKQAQERRQQYLEEPQPQEVLGTMIIGFSPTVLASLPEPPIDLTLHIRPLAGGHDVKHHIADGTPVWELLTVGPTVVGATFQNFRLVLPAGDYLVEGLDVRAPSLSDKPFFLATGGPSFTVPKGNCVYIGRIGLFYSRLPPGSLDQAKAAAGVVSAEMGGRPLLMIYLPKGALLVVSSSIDQPTEDERTPAADSSKRLLADAHQKKCAVQLAKN